MDVEVDGLLRAFCGERVEELLLTVVGELHAAAMRRSDAIEGASEACDDPAPSRRGAAEDESAVAIERAERQCVEPDGERRLADDATQFSADLLPAVDVLRLRLTQLGVDVIEVDPDVSLPAPAALGGEVLDDRDV
ncbi:MAG: hypothetical protein ACRDM1_06940, partial [Gaiellaceae bacterium]